MNSESSARRVVERYLHEVLEGAGPASPEDLISNETLRQQALALRRAFGDLVVTTNVVVETDAYAAVHFSARGLHRDTFQGVRPTGRPWTASCSAVFRVEAGRIADFWINWDVLAILEQIGGLQRSPHASA
jgi:predicted ester cyclase